MNFRREKGQPFLLPALLLAVFLVAPCRGGLPSPVLRYGTISSDDRSVTDEGTAGLSLVRTTGGSRELDDGMALRPADSRRADTWLTENAPDELSVAFWVRFDKLPSKGTPTGLFDLSADRDGFLSIRLFAAPGEFQGDYRMRSAVPVARGAWAHVEFSYSRLQSRAALYLDGRFQWENDVLHLPRLRYGPLTFPTAFEGALRDFRLYDMALPSDHLAIARGVGSRCDRFRTRLDKLHPDGATSNLKGWHQDLRRRVEDLASRPATTTRGEVTALDRDIGNLERIAGDLAKNRSPSLARAKAIPYVVAPLSQELLLPHCLPGRGSAGGPLKIAATRGEYENGSVLLFALGPVEIRGVKISPLTGPGGKTIPSEAVDVKLVKRWFRSGGAWLSYHGDRRQRNLTPDLLLYDDDLVRVDEWRRRNYLRFDDPDGPHYRDISDPSKGHVVWNSDIPVHDATNLRPVKIAEGGRNQQFLFTLHVPEEAVDGLYRGEIRFEGADLSVPFVVRVLPFDLPLQPSPYHDIEKTYISTISSFPLPKGPGRAGQKAYLTKLLELARSHNLFHLPGIWDSEELIALSLATGMVPDKIFGKAGGTRYPGVRYDWQDFYPGIPREELTSQDKRLALPLALRSAAPWQDYFRAHFPATAEPYVSFFTETRDYATLNTRQAELGLVAGALGQKVYSRGYAWNIHYAGPLQEMHISTRLSAEEARAWHAMGAEKLNFSYPYPGSENPECFRRRIGLRMYKDGYDGQQIRDFFGFRDNWNEFASCPGGDGNYRNFSMVYPQRDGFIGKLALEGLREAYDDLRYATRLRQLALANLDSKDNDLRRECRRQLLWLENIDGKTADLTMVRYGLTARIILLQELIAGRGGILPECEARAVKTALGTDKR